MKTNIRLSRPKLPVRVVDRARIGDLKPVAVALVTLEIVVGRSREIDLSGSGMPEDGVLGVKRCGENTIPDAVAVRRHPESNF
jgi:hypothetical protein